MRLDAHSDTMLPCLPAISVATLTSKEKRYLLTNSFAMESLKSHGVTAVNVKCHECHRLKFYSRRSRVVEVCKHFLDP